MNKNSKFYDFIPRLKSSNSKKCFLTSLLFLFIILPFLQVNGQTSIEIKITKTKNYPNNNRGNSISSTTNAANNIVNFQIQNTKLSSIFNHFNVKKFKPAYPAAFRPDAAQKIKPALLEKLKSIYQIECINCNWNKLKDTLIYLANDTSSGFTDIIKRTPISTASTPNDYSLQYTAGLSDPYFNDPNGSHWQFDKIQAPDAWNITQSNPSIIIGITDNGFDQSHPDIQNKINYAQAGMPIKDHGTATSQLAAGETNNGEGLASMGYNAKLNIYLWSMNSILEAAMNGVRIISNSWFYGTNYDQTDQDIINQATELGSFVIFASGNGLSSLHQPDEVLYPPSYENVFSVTGLWGDDAHRYQNSTPPAPDNSTHQHNTAVDLAAPAYHIWHAWYQLTPPITIGSHTHTYAWGDGTSFAAPLVAGTVALMLDVNPCLTPKEIETILKESSDEIYNIADNYKYAGQLGAGRLNAYKAVLLAQVWGHNDFVVNSGENITWSSSLKFYRNIFVKSGGQLNINSSEVYMASGGKIVVEKNAKLLIYNNSIIRSHPIVTSLSCYQELQRWEGIQVEGQPTFDQFPNSNQGLVNISNSTIQDAINGVSTISTDMNGNINWNKTGGGIIVSSGAIYTNNQRHVQIMSYHRPKVAGIEQNNICNFNNCTFETDQTRFTNSQSKQRMFTNWDTKGITINGCTFKNVNNGLNANVPNADRGTGIYTVDASMKIQDRTTVVNGSLMSIPSVFYDLQIGIDDYHSTQNPLNGHIIKKNKFERNIYGIQQTNSSTSHIYRNNFIMEYPSGYPTYTKSGYWGINAGGFQISENSFSNTKTSSFNDIGATFKNSNLNGGGLYLLNTHTGTNVGGQTEGQNQNLNYKCNSHSSEKNVGLALNPKAYPLQYNPVTYLPFFGNCPTPAVHKSNGFLNNVLDVNNFTSNAKIYVVKNGIGNSTEPEPIKSLNVNVVKCTLVNNEVCQTIEPAESTGWVPVSDKTPVYQGKKNKLIDDRKPLLGGSSQNLLNLVNQGANINANELFDSLNKYSPYLSDVVLIAMITYSQHLSENQIVSILVTNSSLTPEVLSSLGNRNFTQEAIETINSAQTGISERTQLEMTILNDELNLSELRVDLVNYFLAASLNDTINNYNDSLVLFLEGENDELAKKQLASIYLNMGLISSSNEKLSLLDNSNNENIQFISLMNVLLDLKSDNLNVFQMTNEQENTIRVIANSSTNSSNYAKNILDLVFEEYNIERPLTAPSSLGKGNTTKQSNVTQNSKSNILSNLNIYPNPATNYVSIDYSTQNNGKNLKLNIINSIGVTVKSIDLKVNQGSYRIDSQTIIPGVYFVVLENSNGIVATSKLVIMH